jgi:zinc and cadmium transporter
MIIGALLAALVVMITSLVGIVFVQKTAAKFLEDKLSFLVSFSAGVFLITSGALAFEVFELATSLWVGVLLISLGYFLAWLLQVMLPETHHHHEPNSCGHSHAKARNLIIADGIHNMADGVILVTAFSVSPALGLAVTTSVVIHEALQEVSEFFVLKKAGYTSRQALLINFAVSSTILIGVALGYFALASHGLEVFLLAISAGFFLHVVIHDLLPKKSHHESVSSFAKHIALVATGALIMGFIANALSEGHVHGDSHEKESSAESHEFGESH